MTSASVPAGGDPHRLLADVRGLTRRVRLAQRVTWLPLLVMALVTFGAIPVHLLGTLHTSDCRPVPDGQVCRAWFPAGDLYWLATLALGYTLIAAGYLRVARARGVGARVLPYALTGAGLMAAVFLAVAAGSAGWIFPDADAKALTEPPAAALFMFRLLAPAGVIGLALLVLAWLERHLALLLFTALYLTVVLVPVDLGWEEMSRWQSVPMLVIGGTVLLLGGAGFAAAQRPPR